LYEARAAVQDGRMSVNVVDRQALRRGRVATAVMFLTYGTILGAWTARIPAVKQGLDLSDGQLSIALLGFAAGAITGMQLAGRFVDRLGGGRVMIPLALLDCALLIGPAYAPSLAVLVAALFVFGVAHGTLNIAMNANAVAVEQAWASPIMSSFHAVYSIGGFLGAAIGGLFAQAGTGAGGTFLAVGALMAVTGLAAWRWVFTGVAHQETPSHGRTGAMPGILLLAALAFCCLVGEGAAADWASVYLRDTLGSAAGFAAAGYAAFSIMMMVGRLAGDRLATAIGPVRLVRACGILAAVGLGTALLVGQPIAGVIGFGCFGAGLSCIAPLIFSAAGAHNPALAGRAIARVASLGWIGFLVGPIAIGGAAELIGLGTALAIPAALALVVAIAATALRPRPTEASQPA
jgi:predicted MFS family arabinose efflux permease